MATTTNFGWETPDDTDLVKDGALAMRTLGNAIDTSLVDLKGGTTGQVLSKTSNTDMDFTWVTSDDADAIQNSIVDAKGDLITATAADTPARLAVGGNNLVLLADSAQSTGLKWGGDYISYTPTWTASVTNPSIGNGILNGVYRQVGKQVDFQIELKAGSTTTFGSGIYYFSLPVTCVSDRLNFGYTAAVLDAGVVWYLNYYGAGTASGFNSAFSLYNPAMSASWTNTAPFTFGNTDEVWVQGSYRVA